MKKIGYGFIGLGVLDAAVSWIGIDLTGFAESPAVFGSIGAILIYLAVQKEKLKKAEESLPEGESLLKSSQNAGVQLSLTKQQSGILLLTDKKIAFQGTALMKSGEIDIGNKKMSEKNFEVLLGDISSVETSLTDLTIKDKKETEFKVNVTSKKSWKDAILKAISDNS